MPGVSSPMKNITCPMDSLLWPVSDTTQLVPICFQWMGYDLVVSTLVTAEGGKRVTLRSCDVRIETGIHLMKQFAHGPLTRYWKLRMAHAPEFPGTFSPWPRVSDPDMHHGTCVTHVPWRMPGSSTGGFLWSRWRGKHPRRMRNAQFCVADVYNTRMAET